MLEELNEICLLFEFPSCRCMWESSRGTICKGVYVFSWYTGILVNTILMFSLVMNRPIHMREDSLLSIRFPPFLFFFFFLPQTLDLNSINLLGIRAKTTLLWLLEYRGFIDVSILYRWCRHCVQIVKVCEKKLVDLVRFLFRDYGGTFSWFGAYLRSLWIFKGFLRILPRYDLSAQSGLILSFFLWRLIDMDWSFSPTIHTNQVLLDLVKFWESYVVFSPPWWSPTGLFGFFLFHNLCWIDRYVMLLLLFMFWYDLWY